MSVRLPAKDYFFLREVLPNLDYYVFNAAYMGTVVIIDFNDAKKESFMTEYRSLITRIGLNDIQSFNEKGIRLNRIYEQYLSEEL